MKKTVGSFLFILISLFGFMLPSAAQYAPDQLLYGVAYYDEYMPYDRLDKDVQMMKDAGINVVRIAERRGVPWSHRKVCTTFRTLTGY